MIDLTNTNKTTITISEEVKGLYFFINQNEIDTAEVTFDNIQLIKGTEDKPYEPYGAMPSPEFPSRIRNVGDNENLIFPFNSQYYINNNGGTDISSIITDNDNGTYTFTGGGGATSRIKCTQKIKAKENKSFTFNFKKISGDNFRLVIKLYKNDDTIISSGLSGFTWNNTYQGYYKDNPFNTTFICPAETDYILYELLSTNSVTVSEVKLEQGTQATPWTPFGYGSADIKVQNKSIIDFGKPTTLYKTTYTFVNDILTMNGNGSFTNLAFDITNICNSNIGKILNFSYQDIDFSNTGNNSTIVQLNITKTDGTQQYIALVSRSSIVPYEIPNNLSQIILTIYTNNTNVAGEHTLSITKPMLFFGTEAKEYTKHEEQTLHFPLAKVLHKGDYLADDGIHYKRKTIVFDGTEAWFKSSTALVNRFGLTTSKVNNFKGINSDNTLCTHFKYDERNRITINAYHFLNSNALYFDTDMENVTTLEEWKSYLAEQYANGTPVTLEYGLVEEIVEEYTEEQQEAYNKLKQLYSYEDVTHITCENDITCNFNVEHFKDYNILRQNDKQELQAQIDEIKASLTSEVSE